MSELETNVDNKPNLAVFERVKNRVLHTVRNISSTL